MAKRVIKDITGQTFNRLTAVGVSEQKNKNGRTLWEFDCICGNKRLAQPSAVVNERVKSCGCIPRGRQRSKIPEPHMCSSCGKGVDIVKFSKDKSKPSELQKWCNTCKAERQLVRSKKVNWGLYRVNPYRSWILFCNSIYELTNEHKEEILTNTVSYFSTELDIHWTLLAPLAELFAQKQYPVEEIRPYMRKWSEEIINRNIEVSMMAPITINLSSYLELTF